MHLRVQARRCWSGGPNSLLQQPQDCYVVSAVRWQLTRIVALDGMAPSLRVGQVEQREFEHAFILYRVPNLG